MIRVEESVEIGKPVEEVFSYTTNPENLPRWAATVIEVRQEDAPGGADGHCARAQDWRCHGREVHLAGRTAVALAALTVDSGRLNCPSLRF